MDGFDLAPRREAITETGDIRAAIYARTSSTSQRFGYSMDEQVRQCLQRCQRLNWDAVCVFRDKAESGKNAERPMFQQMMKRARDGFFDVVVFWKLDRFSRSLVHAVKLEAELRDEDVALHSVTEQIDTTTSAGRFNFRNIASAAEFESDMISERAQMGLKARAMDGRWPTGQPPLGYRQADDGSLDICESEADLVREIFERYIEAKSMPQVAGELNRRGITTRKNNEWTPAAVGDLLGNELYIGTYDTGGVSKQYDEYQIIDNELFEQADETRRRFRSDSRTHRGPMPNEDKERIVDKMESMYHSFIDGEFTSDSHPTS